MEVMRKFIIDLKSDGTVKCAEVCEAPNVEQQTYKKIADYCETGMCINKGKNLDMYIAYKNIFDLCKRLGKFR